MVAVPLRLSPQRPWRMRCTARQGARLRLTEDLGSDFACQIAYDEEAEFDDSTTVTSRAGDRIERVHCAKGWGSRKCFAAVSAVAAAEPRRTTHLPYGGREKFRNDAHVVVVGAGPLGLACAAACKRRGLGVTLLEAQRGVGGDWRRWGNSWSTLQTHSSGYLIGEPEDAASLPAYPSRGEMLRYFEAFARNNGLSEDILLGARCTGRTEADDDGILNVRYVDAAGEARSLKATHLFVAPGRVCVRREPLLPGEDEFAARGGTVAWGTGGDLEGYDFRGKDVVIVGHGSFALETMRRAIESGSKSITLIARSDQLVLSKAVSYAIDRTGPPLAPTRSAVARALSDAYALLGYDADALDALVVAAAGKATTTPSSDLYFLARAVGKANVVIGDVEALEPGKVRVAGGDVFDADVVVKCVGFGRDAGFDAAVWHAEGSPGAVDEVPDKWANHFVDRARRVYLTSSTAVESFVPLKREAHWPNNVFTPAGPAYGFLAGAAGLGGDEAAALDTVEREMRNAGLPPPALEPHRRALENRAWDAADARQADRCRANGPDGEAFLDERRNEWDTYAGLLGCRYAVPYPYAEIPDVGVP